MDMLEKDVSQAKKDHDAAISQIKAEISAFEKEFIKHCERRGHVQGIG